MKYVLIYKNLFNEQKVSMADKREAKRLRKRLTLKFGPTAADRLAFTEDISQFGLFIKTTNIAPAGSRVIIELTLSELDVVTLEARVMWAKKVPPNMLRLVKKSGMGVRIIRFVTGEAAYYKLCEALHGGVSPVNGLVPLSVEKTAEPGNVPLAVETTEYETTDPTDWLVL
jgi:Tfp pilus assembly protein PilZ